MICLPSAPSSFQTEKQKLQWLTKVRPPASCTVEAPLTSASTLNTPLLLKLLPRLKKEEKRKKFKF
jgi:hypothetical protein